MLVKNFPHIKEKLKEFDLANYKDLYNDFPAIAKSFIEEIEINYSPENVLKFLKEESIPWHYYQDNQFGDFPITLFMGEHIFLDLYQWFNQDTSIHNHHFSGAFKLIEGLIIQSEYNFVHEKNFFPEMSLGKLNLIKNSKMRPGDIQEIQYMDGFIHRSVHLSTPTITLILRTKTNLEISNFLENGFRLIFRAVPPNVQKILRGCEKYFHYDKKTYEMYLNSLINDFDDFCLLSILEAKKFHNLQEVNLNIINFIRQHLEHKEWYQLYEQGNEMCSKSIQKLTKLKN